MLLNPLGIANPRYLLYETPSFSNAGGMGDRRSIITVTTDINILAGVITSCIDGNISSGWFFDAVSCVGKEIKFNFGHRVIINAFRFYKDIGFTPSRGTYQCQISDDGASWIDVDLPVELIGAGTQTVAEMSNNIIPAQYFRLFGTAGSTKIIEDFEFEFKIGNPL